MAAKKNERFYWFGPSYDPPASLDEVFLDAEESGTEDEEIAVYRLQLIGTYKRTGWVKTA